MQGTNRVGHTIDWPGSGARQEHDGGEHSARGEVHRERLCERWWVLCCVLVLVLVLVCVCGLVGEGEENAGFIYPRDPCPSQRIHTWVHPPDVGLSEIF